MLTVLIVLALISGCDEPKKPLSEPAVAQRAVNPDRVVGTYKLSPGIESSSEIIIVKKGDKYEHSYAFATDDGGRFAATGPVRFVGERIDLVMKTIDQNRDFTVDGKRTFAEVGVLSFFLVHWDTKTYLIPEDKLVQFCNKLNLRSKPKPSLIDRFDMRDRVAEPGGVLSTAPELPQHVKKLVLSKPIHGKVLSIEDGRARINLGEQDQVCKDMLLYCEPDESGKTELLKKSKDKYESHCVLLKVVEVSKTECVVEIDQHQIDINIDNIQKGYRVSSRFPDSLTDDTIGHRYFRDAR